MAYPKFRRKYVEESLFSPLDSRRYHSKFKAGRLVPKGIVLCYSPRLVESISSAHKVSEISDILDNIGTLYSIEGTGNTVGLLAQFGIGAPVTVVHEEQLASWGAKRFVILGMAGGINSALKAGDIVVCSKAIRDEGTSHHYLKHAKYAFPSKGLTRAVYKKILANCGSAHIGPSWTIDAPFRETVKELIQYRNEGVFTVEMEASALFAVGQLRGVETAAVFVVSDTLSEKKWQPAFRRQRVMQNLVRAFKSIKEVLSAEDA